MGDLDAPRRWTLTEGFDEPSNAAAFDGPVLFARDHVPVREDRPTEADLIAVRDLLRERLARWGEADRLAPEVLAVVFPGSA